MFSAFANGQDTALNISEQVFEAEFNKLYATKEDEIKAAKALSDAEQEVKYNCSVQLCKGMIMENFLYDTTS